MLKLKADEAAVRDYLAEQREGINILIAGRLMKLRPATVNIWGRNTA